MFSPTTFFKFLSQARSLAVAGCCVSYLNVSCGNWYMHIMTRTCLKCDMNMLWTRQTLSQIFDMLIYKSTGTYVTLPGHIILTPCILFKKEPRISSLIWPVNFDSIISSAINVRILKSNKKMIFFAIWIYKTLFLKILRTWEE